MTPSLLYGFHAVTARLRQDASTVDKIWYDSSRHDQRMQHFLHLAKVANVQLIPADAHRLHGLVGTSQHQGVIAQTAKLRLTQHLSELLDTPPESVPLLLLVLDGVTDPHNLGACLRVANAAGAHAVIAPRNRAVGLNATAAKVASGAAETTPYIVVTNLAQALRECQEKGVWVVGADETAAASLYDTELVGATALVTGAESQGMRRLTRETCDALIHIPMAGSVESLNVSVASGICLFEAVRQRAQRR